jgi:hypothetical protein
MPYSFNSNRFIGALLLLVFISLFSPSCRRADLSLPQHHSIRLPHFFDLPSQTHPTIRRIADVIRQQDEQHHFLEDLVQKQGFALWDKSPVLAGSQGIAASRTRSRSADSVVLIPLVKEGQQKVHSFLACLVSADSIKIRLFDGASYKAYGINNRTDTLSATFVAFQTMALDNGAFGHKWFKLTDSTIFDYADSRPVNGVRYFQIKDSIPAHRFQAVTATQCYEVYLPASGNLVGVPPGGSLIYGGYGVECYSYTMWLEVLSSDFGYAGGMPSGGGGGGSNDWWNDNPCRSFPLSTPCPSGDDNGGWEPLPSITYEYIADWVNGVPVGEDGIVVQYWDTNIPFWDSVAAISAQLNVDPDVTGCATSNLRNLGRWRGWDVSVDPVVFNKRVGKAFEETALQFYGFQENHTNYDAPERKLKNAPNPPTKVRPDAFDNYQIMWRDASGATRFNHLEKIFGVEVKAYNGTLELSSNSWQILGELEVLRRNFDVQINSPYWQQLDPPITIQSLKNGPVLFFITTSDTEIGQSIINEATAKGISIWQAKAIHGPDSKISFDRIKFVYDKSGKYSKGNPVPKDWFQAIVNGVIGQAGPLTLSSPPANLNFDLDPEILEE